MKAGYGGQGDQVKRAKEINKEGLLRRNDKVGPHPIRNMDKNSPPSGDDREPKTVEELTRRNIETVLKLEEAAREQRTHTDRLAEVIARFCGSMTFVWVHVIWFGGWIIFNALPGIKHIDPFPFTFLTLVVSLEAIFLSTFILISQNHDSRVSEKRNHLDLQINLLSEQENTKMLSILQQIAAKVGVEMAHDQHVRALGEATSPEKLVEQLDELAVSGKETGPGVSK